MKRGRISLEWTLFRVWRPVQGMDWSGRRLGTQIVGWRFLRRERLALVLPIMFRDILQQIED